jgi:hypothetical protein
MTVICVSWCSKEGKGGARTWMRTLRSAVICSEDTVMGLGSLTGTIWCFVMSYSEPAVTCRM